jgi:hypothetical protein
LFFNLIIMKYSWVLIILLFGSCGKVKDKSPEFVGFYWFGPATTKIMRPLIISTDTVRITLDDHQMKELKMIFEGRKPITPNLKEHFTDFYYDRVITDINTFRIVNEFVLNHKEFYTDKTHQNSNPDDESFDVVINGKRTFSIYNKSRYDFFDSLIASLKKRHSDKKVIDEVYYLNPPLSKELGTN